MLSKYYPKQSRFLSSASCGWLHQARSYFYDVILVISEFDVCTKLRRFFQTLEKLKQVTQFMLLNLKNVLSGIQHLYIQRCWCSFKLGDVVTTKIDTIVIVLVSWQVWIDVLCFAIICLLLKKFSPWTFLFFQVADLELKPLLNAKEVSMVIHGTYYNSWEKIKHTVSRLLNYFAFVMFVLKFLCYFRISWSVWENYFSSVSH